MIATKEVSVWVEIGSCGAALLILWLVGEGIGRFTEWVLGDKIVDDGATCSLDCGCGYGDTGKDAQGVVPRDASPGRRGGIQTGK